MIAFIVGVGVGAALDHGIKNGSITRAYAWVKPIVAGWFKGGAK